MKKSLLTLLLAFALFFPNTALAQSLPEGQKPIQRIIIEEESLIPPEVVVQRQDNRKLLYALTAVVLLIGAGLAARVLWAETKKPE